MTGEPGYRIATGRIADYDALARFHYRAGRPATCEAVLVARVGGERAGVLVVSRPVLNAPWRAALWPGVGDAAEERAETARRINAEVRCISRVVVEPRFRGGGIATALVRAYLARPRTVRTEAVAAMGLFCGFFRAAGMREVALGRSRRDAALAGAMRSLGVARWRLVDPAFVLGMARSRRDPLERALRRWANDSRGTRRLAGAGLEELIGAAARAVASPLPSRAYGFDAGEGT